MKPNLKTQSLPPKSPYSAPPITSNTARKPQTHR
ncbi:hypothetical protein CCACVL1_05220 [Corchorus capsularis]|uniref:Uncharacterized protein n=1 Tax=Corchorus capsularis TaxID=210143 RepID=A0A1R3JLZ6_COCAP|nr:hypothetical protein CCACVL1_05220 [Corchorus capsularis]